ncbi:leucine-rich repeat protein [Ruminococcus difficilis]|uniref:Leucine-rich repeat protein n=1 Tax=Ruminococcus difficilis TaxID=2763069 RepID=A0A934WQY1_9FIRM|nr:leucine-rich repeat protein [Ruminococcus difficilis]MBK6087125.1 leucine-rich repeat protein [Ruminococcus difficilis]
MSINFKRVILVLLCITVIFSSVTVFYAESVYYYYGFLYTYINNDLVSLYGIEDSKTEVHVPDTLNGRKLVDISNRSCMNNKNITLLEFSNALNLERIGSYAFMGCSGISGELKIPSYVNLIEESAFRDCSSIETLTMNSNAEVIPSYCFYGCTSLNSVTLNNNTTTINSFAFANCSKLSYVEIPSSVTAIAQTAFDGDTITLGVYTDSAAHQYAVSNNIPFILLDAPVPPTEPPTQAPTAEPTQPVTEAPTEAPVAILGDVDGDGNVSTIDATFMQRYLASVAYPAYCNFAHGDVDGDGTITILDVTYIMRYLAGIDVPYPVNEPIQNQ